MATNTSRLEAYERVFRDCERGKGSPKQLEEAACSLREDQDQAKRIVDVLSEQALTLAIEAIREHVKNGLLPSGSIHEQKEESILTNEGLISILDRLRCIVEQQRRKLEYSLDLLELTLDAPCEKLQQKCDRYESCVRALFCNAVDHRFVTIVGNFFFSKLTAFGESFRSEEPAGAGSLIPSHPDTTKLMGEAWCHELFFVSDSMKRLGMVVILEEQYGMAVNKVLSNEVSAYAKHSFESPALQEMKRWIEGVALPFFQIFLTSEEEIIDWRSRLDYKVYRSVAELREQAFFDIVVDFPESTGAVEDLKACLQIAHRHSQMIATASSTISRRLLHAGATTSDILRTYISMIKVLRDIDPDGQLLEAIGGPICSYLRGRKDTIRCIVTMLTDDTPGEEGMPSLLEELASSAICGEMEGEGRDEAAVVRVEDMEWTPAQITTASTINSAPTSTTDVYLAPKDTIEFLVNIYGSKDLFMGEYRVMLAEKILSKDDYDMEREVRTIELLKLRFGENALRNCEVMLKDFADSKRIDSNIKSELPVNNLARPSLDGMDSVILSELFWPGLQGEEVRLPQDVQEKLDLYAERYASLKAPRKILWKNHLGVVNLNVTIDEKELSVKVTPPQAALLLAFRKQIEWEVSALANELGSSVIHVRRWATVWINNGVLQEVRGHGQDVLLKVSESILDEDGAGGDDLEMEAGGVSSMEEQLAQEMSVYESYIIGMLTNFDSLPLDRIHNMLKMFVAEPQYDKSSEQLAAFLGKLVQEEKLVLEASTYRRAGK